jgi:hypothetical protein
MRTIIAQLALATVAALTLAGAALAAIGATAGPTAGVTILDSGTVRLGRTAIRAGTVTFVAVNKGKQRHALAIMGPGIANKRSAAIAPGQSGRLTVTVKKGMYMLWDPIGGSMKRSAMLMVAGAMTDAGTTSETPTTITVGKAPDAPPTMNPGDDDPCMGGMHC